MRRAPSTHGAPPLSLHWPGDSPLHRAPAGAKLLVLLAAGTAVVALGWAGLSVAVTAAVALAVRACGVPWRVLGRQARPFALVAAVIAAVQVPLGHPERGLVAAARLGAVAMLSLAVTLTTTQPEMVATLEGVLLRCRMRPDRVFRAGVAVGVLLRGVTHLWVVSRRVLDARRARGLHRSLRAFAVPTVVEAARFAHGVGEALTARGIAPPEKPG